MTHEYVVEFNGLVWVVKCDCGYHKWAWTEAAAEERGRRHVEVSARV